MNETKQQYLILLFGILLSLGIVFKALSIEAEIVNKELESRENLYTTLEDEPK